MARSAAIERPDGPALTVLPGGKRLITRPLDEAEEAWVELQAVAVESGRFASQVLDAARTLQARPYLAGQVGHELELAAPLVYTRAKHAHLLGWSKLDELRGHKPEPA